MPEQLPTGWATAIVGKDALGMTIPATQARPGATGRLILRRVFDAPHPRPQPHLELRAKPHGNEPTASTN